MSNFKIKSLTLLLVGCASPKDGSGTTSPLSSVAGDTTSAQVGALDSAAGADSAEDASETSGVTSENWPVMQAAAEEYAGTWTGDDALPGRPMAVGTLSLGDGSTLYMFGHVEDASSILNDSRPAQPVWGVVVSSQLGCEGILETVPAAALDEWTSAYANEGELRLGHRWLPLKQCLQRTVDPAVLADRAASLTVEGRDFSLERSSSAWDDAEAVIPPPSSCTSTCGSSEGYSYAGQTAKSNSADTGKSTGCTYTNCSCGGAGTYGLQYQCVEYPARVAGRADWNGNAYTGYWSNTGLSSSTQGPYYKGLLPLGSGTGYLAPQAGDVVTFYKSGTYGHVAVLAQVNTSTVTLYDQNRSCGDQSCDLTYSSSSYTLGEGSSSGTCGAEGISSYTVEGYLHRGWDFGGTYGLASSSTTGASTHNWWLNDASYVGGTTSGSTTDITDYVTINPGASDPYMTSPAGLSIPAYSSSKTYGYRYVSFYIKSNCSDKTAKLYWRRSTDTSFSETRSVKATISGSAWQTLTFDLSGSSDWSGTIDQIRIDPAASCSTSSTDTISFESAWFWR